MESTELYRQLLGIEAPWAVQRVEMDIAGLKVEVHLSHDSGVRFACPMCNASCPVYDHLTQRRWRHLDSCHFRTVLHARTPRVQCPIHGIVQVALPWAQPGGRFTSMVEALAIKVLLRGPGTLLRQSGRVLQGVRSTCAGWHRGHRTGHVPGTCPDKAKAFWARWYFWATHCKLPEIVKVAEMISSRLDNVLSFFTHRLTNATSEGLNSKISTVHKRAYGFRNIDNFKIAVCFHCGGLNLYPPG